MGKYIIKNPKEDSYGNEKENIFIAFDREEHYLGSGYVFPNMNHDMAPEHPLNVYMDINMAAESNIGNEVSCELLDKLMNRAEEIKKENEDIQTRLYFGCIGDDRRKFDFFVSNGFIHDEGTYLLEIKTADYSVDAHIPENIDVRENDFSDDEERTKLINLHNDIFIKTMDAEFMNEISERELLKHFTAYHNNKIIGNIIIYAEKSEDGRVIGKIENLFILERWRSKKIAKDLMDRAMAYFKHHGIEHVQLEVWSANKVAYAFYKKLGFKFVKETELYPGVYL